MEYTGVLVGLGNPGPRYEGTRHNCGFALVSALLELADKEGGLSSLNGGKFSCELWRVRLSQLNGTWLAAMPQTFMNLSGQCVQPLLAWHKLKPEQLVVAHDELDIPAGELRFKRGGGNAGHNVLESGYLYPCLFTHISFSFPPFSLWESAGRAQPAHCPRRRKFAGNPLSARILPRL